MTADEAGYAAKTKYIDDRQIALSDMENRAKYFMRLPTSLSTKDQMKKKLLLANPGLDFELTKKMNDVGFDRKNDYNRDRHQPRPPVHKYSVIGDPLEYGMDFSLNKTETHEKYDTPKYLGHQIQQQRPRVRDHYSAPATFKDDNPDGIPANIRAKFGSKIVDELFADKKAVDLVKERLSKEKAVRRRRREKVMYWGNEV